MSVTVVLMVAAGPFKGRQYEFSQKTKWTVGRACDCSLQLPGGDANLEVSRHHCVFEINPPDLVIRDLGSLNGTYVNGTRIGGRDEGVKADDLIQNTSSQDTFLLDGDVIRVGNTVFCVVFSVTDRDPEVSQEYTLAGKRHEAELAACN